MNIIEEEKIKLASPVPWLVFDEAVMFLLLLICATFYYTYHAFANVKKEQGLSNNIINLTQTATISPNDLYPYLTGVVQIICVSNNNKLTSGSGILWNIEENAYGVLTNNHVIADTKKCAISINDTNNEDFGIFNIDISTSTVNKYKDIAILKIKDSLSETNKDFNNYNFNISNIRKCPSKLSVGSPVSIIGYPSYTKRDTSINIKNFGDVQTIYRSTTNGIISGYDTSLSNKNNSLNENYFISAKIDIGNSGGVAISKDNIGLCMLGIPTWVTIGDYENQGLVQNINNIVP